MLPTITAVFLKPTGRASRVDCRIACLALRLVEVKDSNICVVCISPAGAIATEDAPEQARNRLPAPTSLENAFVLAAQLPLDLSGETLQLRDGELVVVPW